MTTQLDVEAAAEVGTDTSAPSGDSAMTLLVDHANIPFQTIALVSVIQTWLDSLAVRSSLPAEGVGSIRVRAYGGWYAGDAATAHRYAAAEFYQRTCPSVFLHHGRYFRVSFEFGDTLILPEPIGRNEPSIRITHTVGSRETPMRLARTEGACPEATCEAPAVYRWIKRGRGCTSPACPRVFGETFRRLEQKQVDVHLALDLQTFAGGEFGAWVAIATDDTDLLPAVAAAAARMPRTQALSLIRFDVGPSYMDDLMRTLGVVILRAGDSS